MESAERGVNPDADLRRVLDEARRVVVKIGSSLLLEGETLRRAWLDALARDVAALCGEGRSVVVVSSGAVGMGRNAVGGKTSEIAERQAAAAVGQIRLSEAYRDALSRMGLEAAQVLLTPDDTEDRRRHLNARATLEVLLGRRIVPVINENDTVATEELKFGDNDRLAARVAQLISADLVVLLSDVDGLYTSDPRAGGGGEPLPRVDSITPEVEAMAGARGGPLGTGGMASKVAAARIAVAAGAHLAITSGRERGALEAFWNGARATWFVPRVDSLTARKAWIAATVSPRGSLVVDDGAGRALADGASLLAVGVRRVEGTFGKGDPVRVMDLHGRRIGVGLANYDAEDARQVAGHRTERILELLGYDGPPALIHRDNLVLTDERVAAENDRS